MKRTTTNTKATEQVDFCNTLMSKLTNNVIRREKARMSDEELFMPRGGYKTQIQNDIIRLRRELAELSRIFDVIEYGDKYHVDD